MAPFVRDLPARHGDPARVAARADLARVERIAAMLGLAVDRGEVGVDREQRIGVRAKALELGMVAVSSRALLQDALCEQRLAPERHEPARVEVSGVERPE